jgi:hypothetical protein
MRIYQRAHGVLVRPHGVVVGLPIGSVLGVHFDACGAGGAVSGQERWAIVDLAF